MVASSSSPTSGRSASASRSNKGASASVDRLGDRQRDGRDRAAAGLEQFGAAFVGDDQLGLGQIQRVAHLVGLPPAVDQGRDAAGLQHRHVSDDPGRAVAHGDGDAVALGDVPASGQHPRQLRRLLVELGEGQPLLAGDHGLDRPFSAQKASNRPGRVAGKLATIVRPCASMAEPDPPALADDRGQHLVIFPVQVARHPAALRFAFPSPPSMKARAGRGKP